MTSSPPFVISPIPYIACSELHGYRKRLGGKDSDAESLYAWLDCPTPSILQASLHALAPKNVQSCLALCSHSSSLVRIRAMKSASHMLDETAASSLLLSLDGLWQIRFLGYCGARKRHGVVNDFVDAQVAEGKISRALLKELRYS